MPIRLKILLACLVLTGMTVCLGLFALSQERKLGSVALRTYDEAFMSVNFIRSAETRFERLRGLYGAGAPAAGTAQAVPEPSERQRLIAQLRGEQPAAAPQRRGVDAEAVKTAVANLLDDLDVAIERATSDPARAAASTLRKIIEGFPAVAEGEGAARLEQAAPVFEQVVDLYAQDGFAYRTRAEDLVDGTERTTWIAIAGAMVAALFVTVLLGQSIVPALRRAARLAGAIADGRLDNPVTAVRHASRSETAALLQALGEMQSSIRGNLERIEAMRAADEAQRAEVEAERQQAEAGRATAAAAQAFVVTSVASGLRQVADGDLTCRLDQAFLPEYETLRADFNAATASLQDLVRGIVDNISGLRSGTGEIAQAADDLSRRTEQQAASLEETAAALDQITAAVKSTAEGAKQAREVVLRTSADAEQSSEVVRQAITAIDRIEQSSQQIGRIIGVIDEIAFQTNLLALNAGVEAARAGDAGRGFAVVASEVRALAQRSAEAAKEIKTLISASAQQVGSGVKLVGQTGQVLTRIVEQVAKVTSVVSDIAGSAEEQASGLAEVNAAINQMDRVTQQNAAMVEQSTAAARSLAQDTEKLVQLTGRFQVGGEATAPAKVLALRLPAASAKPMAMRPAGPAAVLGKAGSSRSSGARKLASAGAAVVNGGSWEEF
jgi:methyl-accepting chemotaxis protein